MSLRQLGFAARAVISPFVMLILISLGCSSPKLDITRPSVWDVRKHVIEVDLRGAPVDPLQRYLANLPNSPRPCAAGDDKCRYDEYKRQLDGIFNSLHDWYDEQPPHSTRKILIFAHGGLNPRDAALIRAYQLIEPMEKAGYYPIFINWDSDLVSSYPEHLTRVRQGKVVNGVVGGLTSPILLTADFARALGRAPMVWMDAIGHGYNRYLADV